jgi:hypothetical protein
MRVELEVMEIAEEFVETVVGRPEFVVVAEMVLPELAGRVAQRLEDLGDRDVAQLQASPGARRPDRAQPVRKVHCPVMKVDRPAVQLCSA